MPRFKIDYFIYGIVFFIPLIFVKQLADFYAIKQYVVQTLLVFVLAILFSKEFNLKIHTLVYFYLAFLGSILLSISSSLSSIDTLQHFYFHGTGFLIFLVVLSFLNTGSYEQKLQKIIFCWLAASTLTCFYGLGQAVLGIVPYATFGNKNIFAAFIIATLPLIVSLELNNLKIKKKIFLIFLLMIHLLALYVTESRAAWFGCIVSLIFFAGLLLKNIKQILVSGIIALSLAGIIFLFRDCLTQILFSDIRFYIWSGAWHMWQSAPWLGLGAGTFFLNFYCFCPESYYLQEAAVNGTRHAHNEYLQVAAEQGILGVIIFLGIIVCFLITVIDSIRVEKEVNRRRLLAGLGAGFVALIVHNVFSINLRFPSSVLFFYLLPAFCLAGGKLKSIKLSRFFMVVAVIGYISFFYFFTIEAGIANYFFKQGIIARNKGNFTVAINYYEKALKKTEIIRCREMLAFAYAQMGLLDKAYEQYQIIVDKAPYSAADLRNAGIIAARLRKFTMAINYFQDAIALNKYDLASRQNLIAALYTLGQNEKAVMELKRLSVLTRFLDKN